MVGFKSVAVSGNLGLANLNGQVLDANMHALPGRPFTVRARNPTRRSLISF